MRIKKKLPIIRLILCNCNLQQWKKIHLKIHNKFEQKTVKMLNLIKTKNFEVII